jgi:RecB family endonuclease NucS
MLNRTATGWIFDSEKSLEDLVWNNLDRLFPVTPIARQLFCKGEICDIIAIGAKRELVIIELKNAEDRYVVQQLTRYYDNLIDEKPFSERIDYHQPVKLIGIAPIFHRHNFIDRKYIKLEIDFLNFSLDRSRDGLFWLSIESMNKQQIGKVKIPYEEICLSRVDLPPPPSWLVNFLGGVEPMTRSAIINIREKILSFDRRIEEIEGKNNIIYGNLGKGRQCAELLLDRKNNQLVLFLWLPFQERENGFAVGRHRVWTDWQQVTALANVVEGLGDKKTLQEWREYHRKKDITAGRDPRGFFRINTKKTAKDIDYYLGRMSYPKRNNLLVTIVNVSLNMWKNKMG